MSEKLERQKITERDDFTYEEKERIAAKSDHKCAHCGRKVYYGYGATVDHFIPLSKGGTNRGINLIMLCHDCNRKKGDLILKPSDYTEHLKGEDRDMLNGYFESYIRSFEYVDRRNILACDIYTIRVAPLQDMSRWKNKLTDKAFSLYYLKRAGMGDIPRMQEYLIKYLKKYSMLDNNETARTNIEFWMRFGCIYYIEKNGDVKLMMTVTSTEDSGVPGKVKAYLTATIFSYYSNDQSLTLVNGIIDQIPMRIMEEQGLKLLPVKYEIAEKDRLSSYALKSMGSRDGNFRSAMIMFHMEEDKEKKDIKPEDEEVLAGFFGKFADVYDKADKWVKSKEDDNLEWMLWELKTESKFTHKRGVP